ncbi:hypothetical protein HN51_058945 [Arachis hypogaea]|uniref:Uncharacterized protein n=1 Tax=Arachis hypogaea TaxID=3818 RepID=A0A444X3C9_ARAHY|nr:uncharacterized protein LOC112784108 [Arachis hypogaea]QHN82271.1 uncharacterized protein DS421_20g694360 [Arachis hypogaea]RYQ84159.1 hypothetical protein Ahy_B10g103102 [Arachis hypogaea]
MDPVLRGNFSPPVSSDPEPLPRSCATELTRYTSASPSSAITVDNCASKDSSSRNFCAGAAAAADAASFPDILAEWTDKQHRQYLNSLEASFVNELHRSMSSRGWCLQNNTDQACKPRTIQNSHHMPRQSLALHDICRKKISFEKFSTMLESTADSHVLAGSQNGLTPVDRGCSLRETNTYDHVLLCDDGVHAGKCSSFSDRAQRRLEQQYSCCSSHPDLVASTAEVTDQNFNSEVAGSSCMPVAKKAKTDAAEASSNDQVVPFGIIHTLDASIDSYSASRNKGRELLSKLPESLHFSKSDLHHFLRGS